MENLYDSKMYDIVIKYLKTVYPINRNKDKRRFIKSIKDENGNIYPLKTKKGIIGAFNLLTDDLISVFGITKDEIYNILLKYLGY